MDDATSQETYTAEQQQTLESGLRVLARMIVRAHLRQQAALSATDADSKLDVGSGRASSSTDAGDRAGPGAGR